ncbi:MAG: hypothetical protein JST42_25440, partial [Bacteroidetes bacterium]|nr:hypothetical protein [Bacteroidota bacterium]
MKRWKLIVPIFLLSFLLPTVKASAQFTDIIREIIVAADVAVQKVQNATIALQNA